MTWEAVMSDAWQRAIAASDKAWDAYQWSRCYHGDYAQETIDAQDTFLEATSTEMDVYDAMKAGQTMADSEQETALTWLGQQPWFQPGVSGVRATPEATTVPDD
jgi:hypothetical protein